jgi:hypothetical protein
VLDLLRRKKGVTIAEIAEAPDWQNRSIPGLHFRPTQQENGAGRRVHEERGWRGHLSDREIGRATDPVVSREVDGLFAPGHFSGNPTFEEVTAAPISGPLPKRYGVTGDLHDQPILADLPGVRIYV